ncbi:MAG: 50S ribosomal protein L22 [Candidatus Hydrogenedentota bacterium]|nr:MAG: 50S ribosomal protein L22 [Candidatus Hydrogenedentota bacterium]
MADAVARAKRVHIAPRKMRLVADLIRGKKVSEARDILFFTPKASSPIIRKILESAVANAENKASETNARIDTDEMVVSTIRVDEAETIKRFRAAARGRAVPIRKRQSNVELIISES